MNIVAMIGNVASDPEVRTTSQGQTICTFRVAVAHVDTQQEADFFDVVTWERQAEMCGHFLDIGRRIALEGRIHCRTYDDATGTRHTRTELVASRIELLSSFSQNALASRDTENAEAAQ